MQLHFYARDGKAVGPLPLSVLKGMLAAGELAGDTFVWSKTSGRWNSLKQVIESAPPELLTELPPPKTWEGSERPALESIPQASNEQHIAEPAAEPAFSPRLAWRWIVETRAALRGQPRSTRLAARL